MPFELPWEAKWKPILRTETTNWMFLLTVHHISSLENLVLTVKDFELTQFQCRYFFRCHLCWRSLAFEKNVCARVCDGKKCLSRAEIFFIFFFLIALVDFCPLILCKTFETSSGGVGFISKVTGGEEERKQRLLYLPLSSYTLPVRRGGKEEGKQKNQMSACVLFAQPRP